METRYSPALVQHYAANYTGILPVEHSLNFFVNCSEARLRRLRHGTRLTDAVQSHQNIFAQTSHPRRLLIPSETHKQLLQQGARLGLGQSVRSSENSYYPLEQLVNGVQVSSAAMREYRACRLFHPDLERKKHRFLPNYFLERYSQVSAQLDPQSFVHKQTCLSSASSNPQLRLSLDPFIDKINRIDEEVREEMRKKEELRLREEHMKAQDLRYIDSLRRTQARMRPKRIEALRPKIQTYLNSAVYPETPLIEAASMCSTRFEPIVLSPEPLSERSTGLDIDLTGRGKNRYTPSTRIKKAVARALDFS